jgi:hypothetical protein
MFRREVFSIPQQDLLFPSRLATPIDKAAKVKPKRSEFLLDLLCDDPYLPPIVQLDVKCLQLI